MHVGQLFDVHGHTFVIRRVLDKGRYLVADENGELDVVEGPDDQGRFVVLIPSVRLELAKHLPEAS